MASARNTTIPKFRFHEPVRNLPNHPGGRSGEDRMALRFAQAYSASLTGSGNAARVNTAMARQIPVNGYGIADVVAVNWDRPPQEGPLDALSPDAFLSQTNPVVYAFEVKLRDWRKALMQANRYRFFAHVPVVVLPEAACGAALEFLDTFHLLGVGLWAFHVKSRRITNHFTPAPALPLNTRHAMNALCLVARVSKSLFLNSPEAPREGTRPTNLL